MLKDIIISPANYQYSVPAHNTRHVNHFQVPHKYTKLGQHHFSYYAPKLYNKLLNQLEPIKNIRTKRTLNKHLKTIVLNIPKDGMEELLNL